jgi:acyl-CoA hydrolase
MVHSVAQRCSYLAIPAYKYLIRSGSALNSNVRYSHKTFQGYLKIIDVLAKYVDENKNRFTKEQLIYFERPFYKYTEMALLSNIIPNLSVVRYSVLRKKIKEYKLTYLDTKIKETVPLYATHWSVFISYYGLKKILSHLKSQNNGI